MEMDGVRGRWSMVPLVVDLVVGGIRCGSGPLKGDGAQCPWRR
jgi:hypothetical protein